MASSQTNPVPKLQPGSPIRLTAGSYAGKVGTVARLTPQMVYVSSPDIPGGVVRVKQDSVRVLPQGAGFGVSTNLITGSPVRFTGGTYEGMSGVVTRLTPQMVYVSSPEMPGGVRVKQDSVSVVVAAPCAKP